MVGKVEKTYGRDVIRKATTRKKHTKLPPNNTGHQCFPKATGRECVAEPQVPF